MVADTQKRRESDSCHSEYSNENHTEYIISQWKNRSGNTLPP